MRFKSAIVLALVSVASACSPDTVAPTMEAGSARAAASTADKVSICHAIGSGSFKSIAQISANALPAHLAHGDVLQPNGVVPGSPGYVFDSNCAPVLWEYATNAVLDPSAQTVGGNLFVGSGIPATGFGIARNQTAGIELGLQIIYRQGPTVLSLDDYADGILNYAVASGPQSTANGSFADVANRVAWSFQYSVATGINGGTSTLANHTYQLLYDTDAGLGTSFRTLTLEPGPCVPFGPLTASGCWRDQGTGLIFFQDDKGNASVTQNSENYAFGQFQTFLSGAYGPAAFAGPATFDIILQALDGTQIVARNHIVVNVAP